MGELSVATWRPLTGLIGALIFGCGGEPGKTARPKAPISASQGKGVERPATPSVVIRPTAPVDVAQPEVVPIRPTAPVDVGTVPTPP